MAQWEEVTIGQCRLIRGNCYDLLPELQADALITDPPYGIDFDFTKPKQGRNLGTLHSFAHTRVWPSKMFGDDKPFDPRPWLHFRQIILWGAHLYAAHLPPSRAWLLWDKIEGTTSNNYGDGELAWSNLGGVLRIHRHLWHGLLRRGEENGLPSLHPTQKPLGLMRWCVQKTTGVVLDPFAGSFTTAHACVELGRPCVAIEIDPYFWEMGCQRIEQAYAQPNLFHEPLIAAQQEVLFA